MNQYINYHLDPERHRAYARKYREANPDKVKEARRKYRLKKMGLIELETENFRFILPMVKIGE